ncbi:MAG TPA: ATP-binding protein, partial [Vicinamibacterales bacterium]|nr:ATP-binding protein [Vicinamibacterales bacterium]
DRQSEEDHVLASVPRGERVDHFETIRRRKDGTEFSVSLTISPIRTSSGHVIGISKIMRDITEQQRMADRGAFLTELGTVLANSLNYEMTLKTIVNLAVPRIADWCAVDILRDGAITRLAAAHVDPTKSGLARAVYERFTDINIPGGPSAVIRTATPALIPVVTEEMILNAAQGDDESMKAMRVLGAVSYMCVPLVAHGRTLGALTFVTADSRRKYADNDLSFAQDVALRAAMAVDNARAYSHLQTANRLKDEFLATLSHELRTPLNAILGYARMMRSGLVSNDKQTRAIETVERNATSLAKIVEDILDVSRIITGKIRLDVQPVELPAMVRGAIETVQPAADAKGVRVQSVIDPRAGPVSGDPERLQQIVWNLVSNAVKFTPKGGYVQVRVERVNSHVEIVVSDTGAGIAPEFLPHIFERFRQADAGTTRERGGLGLGLAIARHLVELHGGTIHVVSDGLGKGSTFRVKLPLMIVHREHHLEPRVHPQHEHEGWQGVPPPNLAGVRVLAVDDDGDALMMIREILESTGAEVTTLDSGPDALSAVELKPPDVIIADLGMPGMDGFELISQIRRSPRPALRAIPAAALTAFARSEDRARALRAGFHIHLGKPVDPLELMAAIAALAGRTGTRE